MIYHFEEKKGAVIFFSNGKLICTGVSNVDTAKEILNRAAKHLKDMGVNIAKPQNVDIHNIIATYELNRLFNLNSIAITLDQSQVEYKPERFEGLVYRKRDPSIVAILYRSGKIVCSGAKSVEDIEATLGSFLSDLESTGQMS